MLKTLSLLALGAVALAGCDIVGSESSTASVASIQAFNVPSASAEGVTIEIHDAAGRSYYAAAPTAEGAALTVRPGTFEAGSPTQAMVVAVMQADASAPNGKRFLARSAAFTAAELATATAPIALRSSGQWYSFAGCAGADCPTFTVSRQASAQ